MCLPIKPYEIEREWTSTTGLRCAVVTAVVGDFRCGYVRVPSTHPSFGMAYDDVQVEVHGGLTFGKLEPCTAHPDGQGWWFGFDCAHFGDAFTYRDLRNRFFPVEGDEGDHHWTQAEVELECESLAAQLAALAGGAA